MTPEYCPYCGARTSLHLGDFRRYLCGSVAQGHVHAQDRACARYVRVRISQLRRMAHTAWLRAAHHPLALVRERYNRFAAACIREIDRLRTTMEPKA